MRAPSPGHVGSAHHQDQRLRRLVKVCALLGSPVQGEVLSAADKAHRLATELGGWEQLLGIAAEPRSATFDHVSDFAQASDRVLLEVARLSSSLSRWERSFVSGIAGWIVNGRALSPRQRATLLQIAERVRLSEGLAA